MCGIVGYWNLRSGVAAEETLIRRMAATLVHRGPDDEGHWCSGEIALGMRRLAVIDLPGGHQPMQSDDGKLCVVFNGEIYNHIELRDELRKLGYSFRGSSDTEVIVRAYEAWGVDCLGRFNGMFAIAVWDGRKRELLLARDRLGIKPLYIWEGADGIVFGSELKAVIASPLVPMEIDLEAIDDFMTYEYVPAPRSIVRDVEKLRPGHWRAYSAGDPTRRREMRYWRLEGRGDPSGPTEPDARKCAQELRERLGASVRQRLLSDVPLGAFLSGGVDSSAIVALMSERKEMDPVQTFALGFDDPSYDERGHARHVAQHLGSHHRDGVVTPNIANLAEQISDHFDEPFGDVSAFPMFWLSGLARKEVTVVLSGDGGDELFAGYDHYRAQRWSDRLGWIARSSGWAAVDRLLDLLPPASSKRGPTNLAKRFVEGLRRPWDLEHARWWVFWDLDERRALYSPELQNKLSGHDCFASYRERLREGSEFGFSGLQRQLYADLTGYLPDDILVKVDRMSMAASLEARVPFLDHNFVEYAMGLPDNWKLKGDTSKWILKEAMRGMLPEATLRRRKEGFSIPMKNWLRGPLQPLLHELLGGIRTRGWFNSAEIDRLAREHVNGKANHAHRLWCLMSLELSIRSLETRSVQS